MLFARGVSRALSRVLEFLSLGYTANATITSARAEGNQLPTILVPAPFLSGNGDETW